MRFSFVLSLKLASIVGAFCIALVYAFNSYSQMQSAPIELLYNKGVTLDQMWEGAVVSCDRTGNQATEIYGPDQYRLGCDVGLGRFSGQRVGIYPRDTKFRNSLEMTVTRPVDEVRHQDHYHLEIPIEGTRIQELAWGTPDAIPLTCQFYFSSSLNGTFSFAAIEGSGDSPSDPLTFNYDGGGEFQHKIVKFAGPKFGNFPLKSSGFGFKLMLDLGSGSDFEADPDIWQVGVKWRVAGTVSLIKHAGASIRITGLQCDPGTVAQPFRFVSPEKDLADAQRFYWKTFPLGTPPAEGASMNGAFQPTDGSKPSDPVFIKFAVPMSCIPGLNHPQLPFKLYSPVGTAKSGWFDSAAAKADDTVRIISVTNDGIVVAATRTDKVFTPIHVSVDCHIGGY